ncbi:DUF4397 domain-containing protein [Pedobacter sp. SYP-B3415]|uniref:DUF4397 domain-containing protein n=1 Tax=Pedobacter sp. SYP-B3415 TaxID=2496641 RepID=UPI00101C5F13|nr:DUF4397 domain-containing protein [Pedobacter sp. SYP-B3415]
MKMLCSRKTDAISTFLLLCFVFTTSCKKVDPDPVVKGEAKVRLVNAAKNSASAEFYTDDIKISSSAITYGQASDYMKIGSGPQKAQVAENGLVAISNEVNFVPGFSYTAFTIINRENKPELMLIRDSQGAVEPGKAMIRIVHLANGVFLGLNTGMAGGINFVTNQTYKSESGYFAVDPGIDLLLYSNGGEAYRKTIPGTEIQSGKVYTVWVDGGATDLGYHLIEYQ